MKDLLNILWGVLFGIAVMAVAVYRPNDAPKPKPLNAEAVVYCLLERTDFDPYSTTIETMTGAMRYCLAWVTRDTEGEL